MLELPSRVRLEWIDIQLSTNCFHMSRLFMDSRLIEGDGGP